jgi:hypothetical protein
MRKANKKEKVKGNRTRIKSDSSGFARINPNLKRFKIRVNPLNPRHPRSIEVLAYSLVGGL